MEKEGVTVTHIRAARIRAAKEMLSEEGWLRQSMPLGFANFLVDALDELLALRAEAAEPTPTTRLVAADGCMKEMPGFTWHPKDRAREITTLLCYARPNVLYRDASGVSYLPSAPRMSRTYKYSHTEGCTCIYLEVA